MSADEPPGDSSQWSGGVSESSPGAAPSGSAEGRRPAPPPAPFSITPPGAPSGLTPDTPTLGIPVRTELGPEDGGPATRPMGPPAGRYIMEAEIGRGGMGAVYRAFDRDLRRHVALKVTLSGAVDREALDRFVEEAQATAQLQHPGIVPVYDIGLTADGSLFFTMKLVRGRTLAEVIERARAGGGEAGEFTPFRLLQVFVEVARAVAYAHERGLVHRDLKPQNIMLGRHGEVHVMDWGLAKVLGRSEAARPAPPSVEGAVMTESGRHETLAGSIVGTPSYMPPEQARGDLGAIGPHSDVYALGATLYRIITGRAPFQGSSAKEIVERVVASELERPRALDRSVPREIEAICLKAMAKEPGDRYASAQDLAEDVQAYLEGAPVAAYPERTLGRALKAAKRHRTLAATIAIAVVLGLVGSIAALIRIEGERRVAVVEHARAVAREREARFNLERVHYEKAAGALAEGDARTAAILFATALGLEDRRETRERLIAARARGARLTWRPATTASRGPSP